MQPVVCWEKVWVAPEHAPNSMMRVYKWVKTDKKQQFSDDEGGADDPLAPLPDEPEVVDGDEDMDQDEPTASMPPETEPPTVDVTETNSLNQELPSEPQTKPPSPTPALSFRPVGSTLTSDETTDMFDASLKLVGDMNVDMGSTNPDDVGDLDMGVLDPDGTGFGDASNIDQMVGGDTLLEESLINTPGNHFVESLDPGSSHPGASPSG
ncbi:hypothetical protein J3A83DRAFT_3269815 [Scleroderma citrinum]